MYAFNANVRPEIANVSGSVLLFFFADGIVAADANTETRVLTYSFSTPTFPKRTRDISNELRISIRSGTQTTFPSKKFGNPIIGRRVVIKGSKRSDDNTDAAPRRLVIIVTFERLAKLRE